MPNVCVPQSGGRGMIENNHSFDNDLEVLLAKNDPPNTLYRSDRVLTSPIDGQVLLGKKNA